MDRFTIQYDESGVQLHNDYIGKIAEGIIQHYKNQNTPLIHPEHTYGMIHRDRKTLEAWERLLKKEGLL